MRSPRPRRSHDGVTTPVPFAKAPALPVVETFALFRVRAVLVGTLREVLPRA
jgi:hypothetical protein